MSELTLLLLQIGFLLLLWFFVFAVVYSLRADVFGVRVRRMPEAAAAGPSSPRETAPVAPTAQPEPFGAAGGPATRDAVSRNVITSGPKAGLELPL